MRVAPAIAPLRQMGLENPRLASPDATIDCLDQCDWGPIITSLVNCLVTFIEMSRSSDRPPE
jgi:hypothetical protein